jgi:hypothetical protein
MTAMIIGLMLVCELAWRFLTQAQALCLGLTAAVIFTLWRLHPHTNKPLPA